MKKAVFALLAAATPVSLQAQRTFESTFDSWNHPNHSIETFNEWVITGYTDLDQNSGLYMPSFKVADLSGAGLYKFHTDFQLGSDIRLMDFTIRGENESIILAGYTLNWPYELVLAEVDFNGNFLQATLHANQNGYGILPHQVIWSPEAQQVVVVGTYLQDELDGANGATVPKTAFVLGVDLNDLAGLQFDNEVDTPQGGFTDNDIYENLTEFPGGYFISGSANDPSSSEQLMTVLGIDYGGGQMHSAIWDNSNSRYTGASVMYSPNSDVVYLLANNSVVHQFEIGYFDPYSGAMLSGTMFRHMTTSLPIGGNVDQNGFRLQEAIDGGIIIGGYFACWNQVALPNLITPFQMTLDPGLTNVLTHRLFQSDNNFDPGDYFSMTGNSVYINTPDMIAYNSDFDRTFLVNPNSNIGGFDTYVSIVQDYLPCEEPLPTSMFDNPPVWIDQVNNPNAPLASNYINENPVELKIREEQLCAPAARSLTSAAAGATLFPNPANERLNIKLDNAEIKTVNLYGPDGALIQSFHPGTGTEATITIGALSAGAYLIAITDAEGMVHREKFIKE